jgi:hypothetical protein
MKRLLMMGVMGASLALGSWAQAEPALTECYMQNSDGSITWAWERQECNEVVSVHGDAPGPGPCPIGWGTDGFMCVPQDRPDPGSDGGDHAGDHGGGGGSGGGATHPDPGPSLSELVAAQVQRLFAAQAACLQCELARTQCMDNGREVYTYCRSTMATYAENECNQGLRIDAISSDLSLAYACNAGDRPFMTSYQKDYCDSCKEGWRFGTGGDSVNVTLPLTDGLLGVSVANMDISTGLNGVCDGMRQARLVTCFTPPADCYEVCK